MAMDLPVLDVVPLLRERLNDFPVVILQAPPGAGKSTILPLQLLDEPWLKTRKIVMLEPRRLAAKTVAERMAQLRNEKVGSTIGYRVRFDSRTGPDTKVEVVTEGILTRKIQADSNLEDVGLLIFDEFHERSLQADLALALSLQIQSIWRSDLRILIMSATLDSESLSRTLGGAPVIVSHGRQYPVTLSYAAVESEKPTAIKMASAIRKALREVKGDILAFLPGTGEIRSTIKLLEEEPVAARVVPLYGDLPFKQQQEAILPREDGTRKIVLATSIAETSLTIEGIRIVIDSGLARVPRFDPRSGLTRLETIGVTKDAAAQRAGRAGRLTEGLCFRLWTESRHRNLVEQRKPEILEADLAPVMLELAQWGIRDPSDLQWITPPPAGAVNQALNLLRQLEAIDDGGITSRGKEMVRLPTHPRISHMLIGAAPGEKAAATDLAALLEERDPLDKTAGADMTLRLEILRRWRRGERTVGDRSVLERIERLAANWRRMLHLEVDNDPLREQVVGKLLVTAYPDRVARQNNTQSEYYTLAGGRVAKLPPHDPMIYEPWLCAAHVDLGYGEGKIFLAAPVQEAELKKLAEEQTVVQWDKDAARVVARTEWRIGGLLLEGKPVKDVPPDESLRIVCDQVREQGLRMLGWGEEEKAMQHRILSLRAWRPQEPWPDVRTEILEQTPEDWLGVHLSGISRESELHRLDKRVILYGIIPWELQSTLAVLAPEAVEVPTGSRIKVEYFADGSSPVVRVRLQEMFGLVNTPAVNAGSVNVILHLLSPGYKPVQVTQDLRSFWQGTYHEVRKELRRRYPKHAWPEDPLTAKPVRGALKRRP
ncbi:MAG: ATP-dependent helicase HrpB [Cytophagales bacterium]|nr:ATP-dependent helicase HrpB [Cytophagales bacterium]